MVVIDTNVVLRFLTRDDAAQAERARLLIDGERVVLLLTVALETAWVLRSTFGLTRRETVARLRAFSGLPQVFVEDADRFARAMDLADAGLDLADALHLAACGSGDQFASFDGALAQAAAKAGAAEVRVP